MLLKGCLSNVCNAVATVTELQWEIIWQTVLEKNDSLFVKTCKQIICLIIHTALLSITIQSPEEMPSVFEQQN